MKNIKDLRKGKAVLSSEYSIQEFYEVFMAD